MDRQVVVVVVPAQRIVVLRVPFAEEERLEDPRSSRAAEDVKVLGLPVSRTQDVERRRACNDAAREPEGRSKVRQAREVGAETGSNPRGGEVLKFRTELGDRLGEVEDVAEGEVRRDFGEELREDLVDGEGARLQGLRGEWLAPVLDLLKCERDTPRQRVRDPCRSSKQSECRRPTPFRGVRRKCAIRLRQGLDLDRAS